MPRARRSGGYMSPAAVRIRSAMPLAAPMQAKPRITSGVDPVRVASPVMQQPTLASEKPPVITGVRPIRSIRRPAGTAVTPENVRKIAGPRPSNPRTPVTSTNVSDDTAATSCRTAEFTAMVAERRMVLRRIGRLGAARLTTQTFNHAVRRDPLISPVVRRPRSAGCFNLAREARGDPRTTRPHARGLWDVRRSGADHGRGSADFPARRLRAGAVQGRQAVGPLVHDRATLRSASDELPEGQRSAYRSARDLRSQRPRRDRPQAPATERRREGE